MGKTYCFVLKDNESEIVAEFTVANDSLRIDDLPNNRRKKLIRRTSKHLKRYPGVLIGRLGVNIKYQDKGYGSELIEFINIVFCSFKAVKTLSKYPLYHIITTPKLF